MKVLAKEVKTLRKQLAAAALAAAVPEVSKIANGSSAAVPPFPGTAPSTGAAGDALSPAARASSHASDEAHQRTLSAFETCCQAQYNACVGSYWICSVVSSGLGYLCGIRELSAADTRLPVAKAPEFW